MDILRLRVIFRRLFYNIKYHDSFKNDFEKHLRKNFFFRKNYLNAKTRIENFF